MPVSSVRIANPTNPTPPGPVSVGNVSSILPIVEQKKKEIANTNDLGTLISIYRGAWNPQLGAYANEVNALAGDKIAQMTGYPREMLSTASDDEIRMSYVGNKEQQKIDQQSKDQTTQINDLVGEQQKKIAAFTDDFTKRAGDYRTKLADNLANSAKNTFAQANPSILEDLNSRGFLSSPTEVAHAQADALKELEAGNQGVLTNFDTGVFDSTNDLYQMGLDNLFAGQESGLDTSMAGANTALEAALNSRRAGLQRTFDLADAAREEARANYLAKKNRSNQLVDSLINGGANLASTALTYGLGNKRAKAMPNGYTTGPSRMGLSSSLSYLPTFDSYNS